MVASCEKTYHKEQKTNMQAADFAPRTIDAMPALRSMLDPLLSIAINHCGTPNTTAITAAIVDHGAQCPKAFSLGHAGSAIFNWHRPSKIETRHRRRVAP
jgi:hypothetical protein